MNNTINLKFALKILLPQLIRAKLKEWFFSVLTQSLKQAGRKQGLNALAQRLEGIVPDITDQYSTFRLDSSYLRLNVRYMHAFQVSLLEGIIDEFSKGTIVDIGDSSGTHLQYIAELYGKKKALRLIGVNLDANAVHRIRQKGLECMQARAEDLLSLGVDADMFLCFETLEHMQNPIAFLYGLSIKSKAKYLIITVPYVRVSRVGLSYIRQEVRKDAFAENTHIFELSLQDWKLVFKYCGWAAKEEKIYLQYPRKHPLRLTKSLWKKYDFEGFCGFVLKKDDTWSSLYKDWR